MVGKKVATMVVQTAVMLVVLKAVERAAFAAELKVAP